MKRFSLVFAALALTGAMAFADDMAPVAKINGYLDTGIVVTNTSSGTTFLAQGNDSGATGYRAKVTASESAANWGVSITFEKDLNAVATVDGATAWVSPMDGLKLSGGSDYDGSVNAVDDNGAGIGAAGVVAASYTTSGFTVAALVRATSPAAASNAVLAGGARYVIDKIATLNFNAATDATDKLDSYSVSFSVAAVPNLTLTGGLFATGVATTAVSTADLTAGYTVTDALSVGFNSRYAVSDAALFGGKAGDLWVKPSVTYKISPMLTGSGYVEYDMTANSNVEAQGELSVALPNTALNAIVQYDTNPGHAATAVATTVAKLELLYTF